MHESGRQVLSPRIHQCGAVIGDKLPKDDVLWTQNLQVCCVVFLLFAKDLAIVRWKSKREPCSMCNTS